MYHVTYRGTHREAGLHWGRRLASHGNLILQNVPFPHHAGTPAVRTAVCSPYTGSFFPAVLQEIDGLAEGQGCAPQALQAVLFSMYAMPPACRCSCFAVSNGAQAFLARNSDFLLALRHLNLNVVYRLDGGFHFMGNTTAFIEIEDGVNEPGFAVGLTAVAPSHIRPGLNAGMLLRLMLETCRTVDEALTLLRSVPVASAQTLTLADAGGAIALVECSCRRVEVLRPVPHQPFVCAVNAFHTPGHARRTP